MITFKLRSGVEVLAKETKEFGVNPLQYTNATQANNKAEKTNSEAGKVIVEVIQPMFYRCFYLKVIA